MPHYGVMPDQVDRMLTWDWVDQRMAESRSYWICTTRPDGRPHVAPIWGAWVDGDLYLGTDKQSVKAGNIKRDNRVVIHLESGDETVIFEGRLVDAQLTASMQARVGDRYIEKYKLDPQLDETDSLLFRLVPRKVMAWRESDFPTSATYWLFDV